MRIEMTRLAFYFDSNACSGCKTCQIACKDKNNLPVGMNWRRVYEITGGGWKRSGAAWISDVIAYNISISCNHCEKPVCLEACPAKAIEKAENGIVTIDPEKCMGCKYCAWTCPYSALQYDEERGVMTKCDMCLDYVSQGKNPACVDACPARAFEFGEYGELVEKHGESAHIHPLPDQRITLPSKLITPHKNAMKEQNESAIISNMEEIRHEQ
jgi:anaerobic dimethyl sulfoxide reductase subunit B (iron-sulfur subunit)